MQTSQVATQIPRSKPGNANTGAIGIIIGGVIGGVILIVVAVFLFVKRRKHRSVKMSWSRSSSISDELGLRTSTDPSSHNAATPYLPSAPNTSAGHPMGQNPSPFSMASFPPTQQQPFPPPTLNPHNIPHTRKLSREVVREPPYQQFQAMLAPAQRPNEWKGLPEI